MRLFLLLTLIFGMSGCSSSEDVDYNTTYSVSMVNLIATPEKYFDKRVEVSGYYNNVGYNLFINEKASSTYDYASSISIISTTSNQDLLESCDLKYVKLEGSFKLMNGRMTISEISRMRSAETGDPC